MQNKLGANPSTRATSVTPTSAEVGEDGLPMPRRVIAAAALMITLMLVVLDGAIANVALPTIHKALDASAASTVWVVTAYQLALVMGLLPCAALGESLGHRRVFLTGVVLFTAASLMCALAPSMPWLIAARFLEGLGAGPIMALSIGLLRFTYPARMIGTVIGWNAMVVAFSTALGPTIGAAILSVASWEWLFAVNIPIGLIILAISRALPRPTGSGRSIDLYSVLFNAIAFGCLVLGAGQVGKRLDVGIALLAVSAIAFVLLTRREWTRAAPLIPLDLLRKLSFRLSVISSICCFAGQMASLVALPFIFQHQMGLTAFLTGLCMTPRPLVIAVAGPIAGRLSDRVHGGLLCAIGGVVLAIGLGLAAFWPIGDRAWLLVAFTMIAGAGFGFFQVPNNRNMLMSVPRERSGASGGMQGTARLIGQTAGSLIMAVLFTVSSADAAPWHGLAIAVVLVLMGGGVSALRVIRGVE